MQGLRLNAAEKMASSNQDGSWRSLWSWFGRYCAQCVSIEIESKNSHEREESTIQRTTGVYRSGFLIAARVMDMHQSSPARAMIRLKCQMISAMYSNTATFSPLPSPQVITICTILLSWPSKSLQLQSARRTKTGTGGRADCLPSTQQTPTSSLKQQMRQQHRTQCYSRFK